MEKTIIKPGTLLAPVPCVMVAAQGKSEALAKPNIITIAWAGQVNSQPPMLSISVQKIRHTYGQLLEAEGFSVNLAGQNLLPKMDLCGVKSGRDIDKFSECGLTTAYGSVLPDVPYIAESPLSLCCRTVSRQPLGSHDLFLAEIVEILADNSLLDADGALHLERAKLVSFAHGQYFALGDILGFFGYSVASPEVLARRMPEK